MRVCDDHRSRLILRVLGLCLLAPVSYALQFDALNTIFPEKALFYQGNEARIETVYLSSASPAEFKIKSIHPARGSGFKVTETFFESSLSKYDDGHYYIYKIVTRIVPMETGVLQFESPFFEVEAGTDKTRYVKEVADHEGTILPGWHRYKPALALVLGALILIFSFSWGREKVKRITSQKRQARQKLEFIENQRQAAGLFNRQFMSLSRYVLADDWKHLGEDLVALYGDYLNRCYGTQVKEKDLNSMLSASYRPELKRAVDLLMKDVSGVLSELIYGGRRLRHDEWEVLSKKIKYNLQAHVQMESEEQG